MINKYPYTDFHEINLDWILREIMKLHHSYDEFKALNTITNAGAWDITKQYQAWTVVSDNNIGYISLKPVPAGIAITNIEYWGVIADYNILITNLSNRISVLENAVSNIDNNELPAIRNDINTINNTLEPIVNKKYVFLGDSYNFYGGGWLPSVVSALGITNYYDYTVSGHGFTVPGGKWIDDLTSFVAAHPDEAPGITDIVIVGGINDSSPSSLLDLQTDLNAFITYASTNLPIAKITMCFVGNAKASSPVLYGRTYENRATAMRIEQNTLTRYGHKFADGCKYALYQYTLFDSDGLHPNLDGQNRGIIPAVIGALNGVAVVPDVVSENMTEPYVPDGWCEYIHDGTDTLKLFSHYIPPSTVIDISGWTTIKTMDPNISGTNHSPIMCVAEKREAGSSTRYYIYLKIEDGILKGMMAETLNSGAYNTLTANNATFIMNAEFTDNIQNSI